MGDGPRPRHGEDGEPADTLSGGNGPDRFHVRDGEADSVNCGDGFDVVLADRKDKVTGDCKVVVRLRARRNDDSAERKGAKGGKSAAGE